MKNRTFIFLSLFALGACSVAQAQGYYDEIYGAPEHKTVVAKKTTTTQVVTPAPATVVTISKGKATTLVDNSEWDVDAYNRRDAGSQSSYEEIDDTTRVANDGNVFSNTQRIERFYNPDIVVKSKDDELLELYFNTTPNVTLVVGSVNVYPTWGVSSWYAWNDPWYDPWYRPWGWGGWGCCNPCCDPWYRPWGWHHWDPWYRPWGWHHSDWGWHRPWGGGYRPWDRPGHHLMALGHSSRLPSSRLGSSFASNRGNQSRIAGLSRSGSSAGVSSRTMNNGRTRPSTNGSDMNSVRRSASSIGNMNTARSSRDISARSGSYERSASSRSGYSRSYDNSSRSATSRSYDSGRSSSGYSRSSSSSSYGSRSSSSGSYSRSSGGFGGGGGGYSRGGGGGGGGRGGRH